MPGRRTLLGLVCLLSASAPAVSESGPEAHALRQEWLDMFSRSYFPGRSGQIMYVPEKNHFFLQSWKIYNHNSPWDYDTHVPFLLYGPAYVKAGVYSEPVRLTDLVPTQCRLLGIPPPPTASGKPLDGALRENPRRPRLILTMTIDQAGYGAIDMYAEELKNLTALKAKSAWFTNCKIDYLPTATAVSHAVIGTGALPGVNGIVANKMYSSRTGKMEITWREGKTVTPANLACPTLADYYDPMTDNRALIIAQCSLPRAAGGMIGHGSYFANGDKDTFVTYNKKTGVLYANTDYYAFPEYLAGRGPESYWEESGGTFRGHEIDNAADVRFSPALVRFMGDVFFKVLEEEPIGADEITDLIYVNQKAFDYTGHLYGSESPEARDVLVAIDEFLGRLIPFCEEKAGADNFVFVLTGDHGIAPSPEKTGGKRIYEEDLLRELQEKFDLNGDERRVFRGASGYNLYVDKEELAENGFTPDDVKAHLLRHESVAAAFTEEEVIANLPHGRE